MIEEVSEIVNRLAIDSLVHIYIAIPLYFLAGLLSSFFPCVYPLYPVTAGFLRNRSTEKETVWKHPLLYWCGMMFSYSILGALAATSGGNFNAVMQHGFAILAIGFLFILLAFVTMDWLPLHWSLGDRWIYRLSEKTGVFFTLAMGSVAGLIASACVAPVLVGMLVLLAIHSPDSSYYKILQGSLLSLSFGAGIGLPLFFIGILGTRLPRVGSWQIVIKYGFALAIALIALYQIDKGFRVLGWSDEQIWSILGGMVLLFLATLLGLAPPASKDRRQTVRFYFSLLHLAFALGLIIRAFTLGANVLMQQPSLQGKYVSIGNLRFYRNYEFALQLAQQKQNPIFIDFYAEWCANCKEFEKLAEKDHRLQKGLQSAVLLQIHDTDAIFDKFSADPRFPELKIGLPFYVILEPNGALRWKTSNHKDIEGMLRALKVKQ